MKCIGLFEAKTHLSAIVEAAKRGESTVISVRGKPTAQIVPFAAPKAADDAIARLVANTVSMGMSNREAIDAGRR